MPKQIGPENWQGRYYDSTGRQRTKNGFKTRTKAKEWETLRRAEVIEGKDTDIKGASMTFADFADEWLDARVVKPGTAAKYRSTLQNQILPEIGDRKLTAIRPMHIQKMVKQLDRKYVPGTVHVSYGITASILKSAVANRLIGTSPCIGIRLPIDRRDPVDPLTHSQVEAIRAALPHRYQALVTVAATTGLRHCEVFGLTVDRSGLMPPSPHPKLRVDRQALVHDGPVYLGPPKREASYREVPLPRTTALAMARHLVDFPPHTQSITVDDGHTRKVEDVELVFTNNDGRPIRRGSFPAVWRKAVAKAGVEKATFHDLRHYYASVLIRAGESVKVVQRRLGHASAQETLDTYGHIWPEDDDRTRIAIDNVFGQPEDSLRTAKQA